MVDRHAQQGVDSGHWAPWWKEPPVHARTISDASGTGGFGIVFDGQVIQGRWTAERANTPNIAVQELLPMLLALETDALQAAGKILILTTDNAGNAFSLNKGTCRSPEAFDVLFCMFDLAAKHRIYLVGDWIPRELNTLRRPLERRAGGANPLYINNVNKEDRAEPDRTIEKNVRKNASLLLSNLPTSQRWQARSHSLPPRSHTQSHAEPEGAIQDGAGQHGAARRPLARPLG